MPAASFPSPEMQSAQNQPGLPEDLFQLWRIPLNNENDPSKAITLGDGTPLDKDAVLKAADLAEEITFDVPWQNGDVALVDNYLVMHGRRTFSGTRKVLASLVAAE